ncbi:hypothetical protein D8Y22_21700 [Salinadaptatus halalkaliphilus]|uniref:Roadblock/LC7 domain-containing protein n=1 Tax=Salinadaptatus halalkaliphilus TaxID=2419781 RepID=A0A4V6RUB4_9EURY|nr:hypothetical protein [Salinadaptatus halalkaliphilus]THE63057.1 hypothetical protein D8Y22_21700 [Salinadaptatus halalkaliphilus]
MAETEPDLEGVVAFARDELGEQLRAVDYFERSEYDTLYIRDDVAGLYTESQFERMSVERMSNLLNVHFFEELYDIGEFHYSVRRFEDALLIFLPLSETGGLVISTEVELPTSIVDFAEAVFERAMADT